MAKEEKDMSWWEPLLGIRSSSPPPPAAAAAKDHEDLIPDPEDTTLTTSSEVGDGSYNISPFFSSFFLMHSCLQISQTKFRNPL
jgi:hypothetical protein